MATDIKELLKKQAGDILTEDTLKEIDTAFTQAVNEKTETAVKERLQLEVESALERQDSDHASKLSKILEAVDADHVNKLKAVVRRIDENHCGKLKFLVRKYRGQMIQEAKQLRDSIVNQLSGYLDLYLDKTVPTDSINEAVQNTVARRMVDNIKKIIAVDASFVTENIREALLDGKQKMDNLQKQLNQVIQENIDLNKRSKSAEASLLLEQKTQDLSDNKREYIQKVLADKDPEYIEENFDYVVEMFERDERDENEILSESARSAALKRSVDAPPSDNSGGASDGAKGPMNEYLGELKRGDHSLGS